MARRYTVPFQNLGLSTSAAQDLFAITTTSTMPCVIEEIILDPCATSVSEFALSLALFTGSYTVGSGGTSRTPQKRVSGDAAAAVTAKTQNTTQTAVGSGTKTVLDAGAWNLVNGWVWQPLNPDAAIFVPVSACLVVSLDTTAASQSVSGRLVFREDY